jgi:hypothetical protein
MDHLAKKTERTAQVVAVVAGSGFLISALVYLYLDRWTVTMQDQWVIYEFLLDRSWLDSVLVKMNGHSLFFPNLLRLADVYLFHGNQEFLFCVGMALLFCTTALLLISFWRDRNIGLTAKLTATLVVIVGNFWMGRASIITSGGFLCENSLGIAGALLAFFWLPEITIDSPRLCKAWFIIVASGFVASFSIGNGLAVWPTLLVLGWSLRLPARSMAILLAAGALAITIYLSLPGQSDDMSSQALLLLSAGSKGLLQLCRLLGAPFLYAEAAWSSRSLSDELSANSILSLTCGVTGLLFAALIAIKIIRRPAGQSKFETISIGLVVFNLAAIAIIVVGRVSYFQALPAQVSAPRYLFWSSLFWTGLFLVLVEWTQSKAWLRWLLLLGALGATIGAIPSHSAEGLHWRYANYLAECGATSLINGVRDEGQIQVLFRDPKQVYRMAPQLRAHRLDMFAAGLQDWPGRSVTSLFGGNHRPEHLRGKCHIVGLLRYENGALAAKVTGESLTRRDTMPKTLIITDPSGVVQGIARSWSMNKYVGRLFYSGKFINSEFLGYIRNYDPLVEYAVRSADEGMLSDEKIIVDTPTTTLQQP